ncbi:MAG: hypothetical protein DMF69_07225 [Acidobacteria bacterium]|nr:MAG: hypothetical protein DMF69_07225 [Acidobacteriota bacterium]
MATKVYRHTFICTARSEAAAVNASFWFQIAEKKDVSVCNANLQAGETARESTDGNCDAVRLIKVVSGL